jgi:sugar phosphate isomerase/epimerase
VTPPIALQLYSVREELEQNFEGVVEKVAQIGYPGVETTSLPRGITAQKAARIFRNLGLTVMSAHLPLPLGKDRNQVLDTAEALGCTWIVSGALGMEHYGSIESVESACDLLNEANDAAKEINLQFAVHNHWWEFEAVQERYPFEIMLERLDPSISFELDLYWIQVAGHDPAQIMREIGKRAPLLHIKDGPATDSSAPMVAVGDGSVGYGDILGANSRNAKWLIVELDRCASDMMQAVERSFQYMTAEGLAHGK